MATFRIHQDQENRGPDTKLRQKDVSQQQKRSVLGVLNKNVVKAQPPIVKQDENVCVGQKPGFQVHEDKAVEEVEVVQERKVAPGKVKEVVLPATITSLHRAPLAEITDKFQDIFDVEDESEAGSPMSLDKSVALSPAVKPEPAVKVKSATSLMLDVEEYREEVYLYLRGAENRHRPKPGYMRKQPDITHMMRSILVDWLVEVAEEYRLQTETLYLAVSYIDRFLSYMSVVRAKLQLVGTAAMFIAAKYEEIYPPDVGEFVYITDDTYTKKQVLRMEHLILKVLAFDLSVPTPLSFLTSFSVSVDLPETTMFLAMYLCELSLLEAEPFLQFLPSELAASAIAIARHMLDQEAWPEELEEVTGYKFDDLKTCVGHLNQTHTNASSYPQQAIREKYKSNRWHNVSLLTPRTPALC